MMMHRRDMAWLLALPLLAGCATRQEELPPETPLLAPDLRLTLPSPAALGRNLRAYQLVTLQLGEQSHVFESHIQIKGSQLSLLLMDMLGRRALQVTWNEAGVTAQPAAWLPRQLRAGSMLADIAVLYWPEASLHQALAATRGTLEVSPRARRIRLDGQPLIQADYDFDPAQGWNGTAHYVNQAWGYRLTIQTEETTA